VENFCSGHSTDKVARRVLVAHDKGRHNACSPNGCDSAFDRMIDRLMEAETYAIGVMA
jgi:hypothetical protein